MFFTMRSREITTCMGMALFVLYNPFQIWGHIEPTPADGKTFYKARAYENFRDTIVAALLQKERIYVPVTVSNGEQLVVQFLKNCFQITVLFVLAECFAASSICMTISLLSGADKSKEAIFKRPFTTFAK